MSTEREVSYGGVVVRGDDVMVIVPRGRRRVLGLPKGGPMAGERPEQTAAREVREETGITATVRERLGQVDYTYRRGGRPIEKTVHFYLCEFEDGDTADHDHEVDDARWMPLAEARRRLSYPGERAMIARALSILAANG
jgi:8-oxo-dGTP pyrophosphatase MutT (NUDIX family)